MNIVFMGLLRLSLVVGCIYFVKEGHNNAAVGFAIILIFTL